MSSTDLATLEAELHSATLKKELYDALHEIATLRLGRERQRILIIDLQNQVKELQEENRAATTLNAARNAPRTSPTTDKRIRRAR